MSSKSVQHWSREFRDGGNTPQVAEIDPVHAPIRAQRAGRPLHRHASRRHLGAVTLLAGLYACNDPARREVGEPSPSTVHVPPVGLQPAFSSCTGHDPSAPVASSPEADVSYGAPTAPASGTSLGFHHRAGEGFYLFADETGWLDGRGNGAGVQGQWVSFDGCDSTTPCVANHLPPAGPAGIHLGLICNAGVVPALGDDPSSRGAGMSLNWNEPAAGGDPSPWDATTAGVLGIAFTVLSVVPETGFRVELTTVSSPVGAYSLPVTDVGPVKAYFDSFETAGVDAGGTLDPSALLAIDFRVAPRDRETPYCFCIDAFAVLTQ